MAFRESTTTSYSLERGPTSVTPVVPLDAPSKTLKAGVHGVPGGENMIAFEDGSVRYLSVREAARVQTFPDSWKFMGAWSETMRQLGNAVPQLLAERLATRIADQLRETDATV